MIAPRRDSFGYIDNHEVAALSIRETLRLRKGSIEQAEADEWVSTALTKAHPPIYTPRLATNENALLTGSEDNHV